MKLLAALGLLALLGCTTTFIVPSDPVPVIGAQLIGRDGECVDVQDGGTADGTPIVVVQCHGSPNQRWFVKNGAISENYGSCLDVQNFSPADGSPVVLSACNGAASQQWSISNGKIVGLVNKCLTEAGGSSVDQTPLILSECNSAPGQLWTVR